MKISSSFSFFRASCRIRTNDPEITNHVLWPTELKRRVGKLAISRRYNQLPLLRSSPGGFEGSWPYRTYPYFRLRVQRYAFLLNLQYFAQTFFNFNKNTGVTNNIIYTFAPLFLMKDDREQRLLTTICHVIRHLPGRILDFEVHFISFRVNYTVPIFPLCRTNSMRAFYGVLLCTNVP